MSKVEAKKEVNTKSCEPSPSGDTVIDLTGDDASLMLAVAKGDARAFACLMQRHLKKMVAVGQRMLNSFADADEVAQEAFLRLWTHAASWDVDGKASLRTWLTRVVINLCFDRLRRRRSVPLEDAGDLIDPADSAFDSERRKDKVRIVKELLMTLPERQRAVVILAYYEELSGAEIAHAMDTSVRAVESLLVRARRALRAQMADKGIAGGEDL